MLLLKSLLDGLLGLLTLGRLLESLSADSSLQGVELESVTSGHQVVVVNNLDERLDLGSLSNLLGAVSLGDLQRVSLNTGNQGVTEGVRLGAIIVGLDDNNLLTSETSADNDSYLLKVSK